MTMSDLEFIKRTGRIRFRKTLFGKIVLQVEEKGSSYCSYGGGSYSPDVSYWRDAKETDITIKEATNNDQ